MGNAAKIAQNLGNDLFQLGIDINRVVSSEILFEIEAEKLDFAYLTDSLSAFHRVQSTNKKMMLLHCMFAQQDPVIQTL